MDMAPEDKGENIRREVCLTLEQMGIFPESSHHEEGPGQNEIDFRYSDPLAAADNSMTFQTVVKTIAGLNGIFADFSPKPLENEAGNGFHINMSVFLKATFLFVSNPAAFCPPLYPAAQPPSTKCVPI